MSLLTRSLLFVICVNVMVTIAGLSLGGDDVVSKYINVGASNESITITSGLNDSIPTTLESGSLGTGSAGFSFIDGLKMIFSFMVLILIAIFAPVYWGALLGFPSWLQLLLFIPTFLSILGTMYVIRGSSG